MTAGALERLHEVLVDRLGPAVSRDAPLSERTTYGLGGPAALLVEVEDLAALGAVADGLARHPVPVLVVGRGSNVLVADAGFEGLALHLGGELAELEVGERRVLAGGGLALPVLARRCAAAGRGGLEFYVGIPGSVGGAVRMNAGGHGRETAEVLTRAWVVDLAAGPAEREWSLAELDLGYRRSALAPRQVVTRAELSASPEEPDACRARIDEVVRWRREHQPGGSNAGSVFTNPPGDSAGRIIDSCGLKGFRVGEAEVSPKHANFFRAGPSATADDVHRLVREVQTRVEERTGIRLLPEITFVGFAGHDGARGRAP